MMIYNLDKNILLSTNKAAIIRVAAGFSFLFIGLNPYLKGLESPNI